MAKETRPSAQELCKLIDQLTASSDLVSQEGGQDAKVVLEQIESLRQMWVRTSLSTFKIRKQ